MLLHYNQSQQSDYYRIERPIKVIMMNKMLNEDKKQGSYEQIKQNEDKTNYWNKNVLSIGHNCQLDHTVHMSKLDGLKLYLN